jgi:hypothetical protein
MDNVQRILTADSDHSEMELGALKEAVVRDARDAGEHHRDPDRSLGLRAKRQRLEPSLTPAKTLFVKFPHFIIFQNVIICASSDRYVSLYSRIAACPATDRGRL